MNRNILDVDDTGKTNGDALEGVVVTNKNHIVESVNTSFCLSTELSAHELLGKSFEFLSLCYEDIMVADEIYAILEEQGVWQGELKCFKKSGTPFTAFISISTVKDETNKVQKYVYRVFELNPALITMDAEDNGLFLTKHQFLDRLSDIIFDSFKDDITIAIFYLKLSHREQIDQNLIQQALLTLKSVWGRSSKLIAQVAESKFIVAVYDQDSRIDFQEHLDTLINFFEKPIKESEVETFLKCQVGMSIYPTDGSTSEQLVQNAKTALYYATMQESKNYCIFNNELKMQTEHELALENAFHNQIPLEKIQILYQPIGTLTEDNKTLKMTGVEISPQLTHESFGIIDANKIYSLCSNSETAFDLLEFLINESIQQLINSKVTLHENFSITFSVPKQAFYKKDFLKLIEKVINYYQLPAQSLLFSVTEKLIMDNIEVSGGMFKALRKLGIGIILNDFGSGDSPLSYLLKYPFNIVKIDDCFTANMLTDKRTQIVLLTIVNLCKQLDIKTIINGINSSEQLYFIKHFPSFAIQGSILGERMDIKPFLALYDKNSAAASKNHTA